MMKGWTRLMTLKTAPLCAALGAIMVSALFVNAAEAYPVFAQQNYASPREANGRLVCANCHLAQKPVEIEVPQAVLPDTVFEAVIKIPYDQQVTQVLGNGKKGGLNVGAVVILPEGFSLAPPERVSEEMKTKVGKLYFPRILLNKKIFWLLGQFPVKNTVQWCFLFFLQTQQRIKRYPT